MLRARETALFFCFCNGNGSGRGRNTGERQAGVKAGGTAHFWLVGELLWGAALWMLIFGPAAFSDAEGQVPFPPEVRLPVAPPETPPCIPEDETTLAAGVRLADAALLQAMQQLGVETSGVQFLAVEERTTPAPAEGAAGERYLFQHVQIALECPALRFMLALRGVLQRFGEGLRLFWEPRGRVYISVNNIPTHEISLVGQGVLPVNLAVYGGGGVAIVIDDIGENMEAVQDLLALDFPVALAVWPRSSHAREAAESGYAAGRDILIHQPMEPLRYPQIKPGPGALMTGMSRAETAILVRDSLRRVPHAVGINNHMGSRLTANRESVQAFCQSLSQTGLFVLDSVTHPASVLYDVARAAGLPAVRRAVFLDTIPDKASILVQLDKAAQYARTHGQAIAIGHPLPATIAALREWSHARNRSVPVVPLRQLVWPREVGPAGANPFPGAMNHDIKP